eukprot:1627218-Prymnesium_polylepis.1
MLAARLTLAVAVAACVQLAAVWAGGGAAALRGGFGRLWAAAGDGCRPGDACAAQGDCPVIAHLIAM